MAPVTGPEVKCKWDYEAPARILKAVKVNTRQCEQCFSIAVVRSSSRPAPAAEHKFQECLRWSTEQVMHP